MTITVTNTFHGTSCNLQAETLPHSLTKSQQAKVAALCGNAGCRCHQHTVMVDGERAGYELGAGDDGRWRIVAA